MLQVFYVNACMIINQFENVVCSLDSIDLTLYINTSDMLKNFQNLVAGSIQYLCKCNWLSNFHSYVISYLFLNYLQSKHQNSFVFLFLFAFLNQKYSFKGYFWMQELNWLLQFVSIINMHTFVPSFFQKLLHA